MTTDALDAPHSITMVRAIVAASRARVRTALFTRAASVAVPGAVSAAAALKLAGAGLPGWTPLVAGLAAAAGAAARAGTRTPTARATAARLDSLLGLRDRTSAALALHESGTPVSALVARDAAARLSDVRPDQLFPITPSPWAGAAIPVAGVLCAWLLVSSPAAGPDEAASAARGAGGGQGTQSGRTNGGGERSATAARVADASARTPQPAQRQAGERRSNEPAATARAAAAPASNASRASDANKAGTSAPVLEPAPAAPAARAGQDGNAGAGGRARTANGMASSSALTGSQQAGAGGVSGAARSEQDTVPATPPPATPATRLATAQAEAAAALARDAVPPGDRDDVRAYFAALGRETAR
jgi:hypothetical protein